MIVEISGMDIYGLCLGRIEFTGNDRLQLTCAGTLETIWQLREKVV